ncbi:MAG: efflux RND transporter periplasmic adaptor subunit [Bacteroidales bacterium]|nr:efflux RND transporter periplasmic adaptor subunit [Bacteroidales bacterium]
MKRKTLIWTLAGAGALTLAVTAGRGKDGGAVEVQTACVSVADIAESIPAVGTVRPEVELEIAAEVSGEIVSLPVKEGANVRSGDMLVRIKQDAYLATLESAGAALGMARAELSQQSKRTGQAVAEHARVAALHAGGAVSDSELEAARADSAMAQDALDAAGYAVQRAEAALREAEDNLSRTTVHAPMPGTISALYVRKGERIVGTSQMAGTLLMKVADLSRMEVIADISETDVVKLHVGDSATIRIDAIRDAEFRGKVVEIANSAKNIAGTFGQVANFEVRIAMLSIPSPRDGMKVRPGMTASVTIHTDLRRGILSVPVQCVFARDSKQKVWTVDKDGRAQSATIKTGIQDFDRIEVLSGLAEGQRVISAPYSAITKDLDEGTAVKVTD